MLISGIGCNLYERLHFGYVRDFIKLNFIDFPVFNISDIFINIGVIALIFIIIKNKYLKK
jgi:signal peptidase II